MPRLANSPDAESCTIRGVTVTKCPAIKVGIDQGTNLKALRQLQRRGLIELHQANELEQTWPDVVQQKKGFMLGYSVLDGRRARR
ncbi:MAG TPA: hypothetical protein VF944_11610 [Candidatus Bathyarchaeia archaeon]